MIIKKCDRCGEEMKLQTSDMVDNRVKVGHWDDYERKMTKFTSMYDLCDSCIKSFQKWVQYSVR